MAANLPLQTNCLLNTDLCSDKVSTYIPFSEREKKNLFSLEGVVRIAQEVRTGEVKTSAQFSKEAVETERASLNPELANDENKKEEGR